MGVLNFLASFSDGDTWTRSRPGWILFYNLSPRRGKDPEDPMKIPEDSLKTACKKKKNQAKEKQFYINFK